MSNGSPELKVSKPQIRILEAMTPKVGLTRLQISEKAGVDYAMCTSYLGSVKDEIREKTDLKLLSLRTRGYVKFEQHDVDGKDQILYFITPAGVKFLEQHKKQAAAPKPAKVVKPKAKPIEPEAKAKPTKAVGKKPTVKPKKTTETKVEAKPAKAASKKTKPKTPKAEVVTEEEEVTQSVPEVEETQVAAEVVETPPTE